jgi:hypothetical protein
MGASAMTVRNEAAVTIDQGAEQTEAVLKIRRARSTLIQDLLPAGLFFLVAVDGLRSGQQVGLAYFILAGVGVVVAESLWELTLGVDLTPESVILRGVRRRSIPWHQVQAVIRDEMLGQRRVRLITQNGKPVTLRAPASFLGLGRAAYDRDFQRIDQWWLAHRGESWGPLRPEAPRMPGQG